MGKVVLDESAQAQLNGLNQSLELCDRAGGTLGYFVPADEYRRLVYGRLVPPYSDDEMARRRAEPGGRPLAAFWAERGR